MLQKLKKLESFDLDLDLIELAMACLQQVILSWLMSSPDNKDISYNVNS